MQTLARNGSRVLFVNSTGNRAPQLLRDPFARQRVLRKLRSLLIFLRRVEPNLFVLTPLALPITRRWRTIIERINRIAIAVQVRLVCRFLNFSKPIIWISSPAAGAAAIALRRKWSRLLVYYCVDNLSFLSGADSAYIRLLDLQLQNAADLLLISGRKLYEERVQQRPEVHLLPHGVDYDHFAKAQAPSESVPTDLSRIAQPIVVYIGMIHGLDLELIAEIATRNPHVSFVFIGGVEMNVEKLSVFRNVHWLGKKCYEDLPRYLQAARCCLLCYGRGDTFNEYRSPKKLLEYFATGLPLVALQLADLHYHAHLVYQAAEAKDFDLQLQRALSETDPELRRQRIEAARVRDWHIVGAEVSRHIRRHLQSRDGKTQASLQVLQISS